MQGLGTTNHDDKTIPNGPWEEIATNFFTLNQKDYLLICDTFSKYPFLFEMP